MTSAPARFCSSSGDVLEDVPHPGSLAHALQEPTRLADRAAVLVETGEQLGEVLVEAGDLVGRPLLQLADIDFHEDGRHAGPDVGSAEDGGVADLDRHLRLLGFSTTRVHDSFGSMAALDHVEAVAGAQDVQDRAADGDRAVSLDAVDVGYDVRAVDDRHAVAAEHLHRVTGEEGGRILVDADAEQSRTARHQGQETTDAIALAEMLVDDHARHEIEPGRHLRHAHAR